MLESRFVCADIPPSQIVFGDEAQLDCFKTFDSSGEGFWFLSMLDRATSFHVVRLLPESLGVVKYIYIYIY